ncbi:hypothetical protein D3C78_1621770 [compost metagenome]
MATANILTFTLLIQSALPGISSIHEVRPGQQLQRLTTGQNILERTRIWRFELQRALAHFEVE